MKFYDNKVALNPRRVRIFMEEKNIDIPKVGIDILKGEHKAEDYRKVAPNARVPALELDDGTILLETMSICHYLEGLYPEPNLLGTDFKEQALIDMWSRRMEFELLMPMAGAFRHTNPMMAALEKQVGEFGEIQRGIANNRLKILNKELADKEYIAGDRYTAADITAYCAVDFFPRVTEFDMPDSYTHFNRWKGQIGEREAVKKSMQE